VDKQIDESLKMPHAGYENFADCVRKNSTVENPRAYCAKIWETHEGQELGGRTGIDRRKRGGVKSVWFLDRRRGTRREVERSNVHEQCGAPWKEHDNSILGNKLPFGCPKHSTSHNKEKVGL